MTTNELCGDFFLVVDESESVFRWIESVINPSQCPIDRQTDAVTCRITLSRFVSLKAMGHWLL